MKTYKNDLDDTVRFRIEPRIGDTGIYLELKENGNVATTVFPASDAPALCLAILEAAGLPDADDDWLGEAVNGLRKHIQIRDKRTAEAKAQAELEAEALELCDSARHANGRFKIGSFGLLKDSEKATWLAVARKAREMRAEK